MYSSPFTCYLVRDTQKRFSMLRKTCIARLVQFWCSQYPVPDCKRNDSIEQENRKCCHLEYRECTKLEASVVRNAATSVRSTGVAQSRATETSSGDASTETAAETRLSEGHKLYKSRKTGNKHLKLTSV
jgi:hypothetical protein